MADTRDILGQILDATAIALLARIKDGSATAADMNVARQLLKDNNINALPTQDNGIGKLASTLTLQTAEEIAAEQENFH